MQFRWVALIALWTILSGPIFGGSSGGPAKGNSQASSQQAKLAAVGGVGKMK
jgi:hypothetical protein